MLSLTPLYFFHRMSILLKNLWFLLETSVAKSHKGTGRSSLGVGGFVIFITAPVRVSLILERKHCSHSSVTHLCAKGLGSKDLCVVLYINPGLTLDLTCSTIIISCTLLGCMSFSITRVIPRTCSFSTGWVYEPVFSCKLYFVD